MGIKLSLSDPELRRTLDTPAARELLQLLNRDGGRALQAAADALRAGQPMDALAALSPVLTSGEVTALLQRLDTP